MLVLIDADIVVYAAGFASDAAAKASGRAAEPVSFCLNGVNTMIDGILHATGQDDYTCILSHPINTRSVIYPEYKANRDPDHKPTHYRAIKEHLLEGHGAVYSDEGDEADDALGIAQCSGEFGETIVATIDKDLDMIPGLHYNWSKKNRDKGTYRVSFEEAENTFYKQLIKGDSTDNIPGLWKFKGKMATAKTLGMIDSLSSERDKYEYVLALFDNDVEFVNRNAQLIWIKREQSPYSPPPLT